MFDKLTLGRKENLEGESDVTDIVGFSPVSIVWYYSLLSLLAVEGGMGRLREGKSEEVTR